MTAPASPARLPDVAQLPFTFSGRPVEPDAGEGQPARADRRRGARAAGRGEPSRAAPTPPVDDEPPHPAETAEARPPPPALPDDEEPPHPAETAAPPRAATRAEPPRVEPLRAEPTRAGVRASMTPPWAKHLGTEAPRAEAPRIEARAEAPRIEPLRAPEPPTVAPRGPEPARPAERAAPAGPAVLTVSELQARLRGELEGRYAFVHVSGEISNYQLNTRSGHSYFTLKDDGAQLKCVLFRDQAMRLRFKPRDGLEVVVRGKITIYEQGGQLQMIAQHVEPKGLGARQLELQQRIDKLRKEGLTADARKRKLPAYPRTIGVVTSRSGAALRDVLRTILRRDPFAHVVLSPTPVQGEGVASEIARALRQLDQLRRCDVILVCRGGGSIEDLWCFNEEVVARAIVACSVPVVTGIGHETDTTIADLVADLRASTPTAAAEHVVPVRSELRAKVQRLEAALHRALSHKTQREGRRLLALTSRLRHPEVMLERRAQRLDELTVRAERAMRRQLTKRLDRLTRAERRLARRDPLAEIASVKHRLAALEVALHRAAERRVGDHRHAIAVLAGRLDSLSPLRVLARGYALVERPQDPTAPRARPELVRASRDVKPGDALVLRLAEGSVGARVESIDPLPPRATAADVAAPADAAFPGETE